MKTKTEIEQDASRRCPYAPPYVGREPWVEGYIEAATDYEQQLQYLRETIRCLEGQRPDRRVVGEAIRELIKARDFLGLQLEHESDGLPLSDEEFEERAKPFLKERKRDYEDSLRRAKELSKVFDLGSVDAEELSVMLSCDVTTANQVLQTRGR
jgi:hypothetical protein